MKSECFEIVGQTIQGIVIKEGAGSPSTQLFVLFENDTSYEFWTASSYIFRVDQLGDIMNAGFQYNGDQTLRSQELHRKDISYICLANVCLSYFIPDQYVDRLDPVEILRDSSMNGYEYSRCIEQGDSSTLADYIEELPYSSERTFFTDTLSGSIGKRINGLIVQNDDKDVTLFLDSGEYISLRNETQEIRGTGGLYPRGIEQVRQYLAESKKIIYEVCSNADDHEERKY